MKAVVELLEGQTHARRGSARRFRKGRPQVLTDPEEIAYYQGNSSFRVNVHPDEPAVRSVPEDPEVSVELPKAEAPPARKSSRGRARRGVVEDIAEPVMPKPRTRPKKKAFED